MKLTSILLFILSFVVVFTVGLAWSFSEKEDAIVFYNQRSHTKLAYIYKHHVHVIPGNSDMVIYANNKPVFMVPYYAKVERFDEETGIPSIVFLDKKYIPPQVVYQTSSDNEKIEEKQIKKAIAEIDRGKK